MVDFIRQRAGNAKNDILSGLTVALALVPEAVAFAFVAGVDPLVGLYAAFMIGLITAIFGGRPGMISGATGALAVVMVSLVATGNAMGEPAENLGLYYLFATVILMGIIQIIVGLLKLGKFVRLIPHPVMMGFVNGLAIVIFLSQLGMFKEVNNGVSTWLQGAALYTMLGLVLLTMAIMHFLPMINKKLPEAMNWETLTFIGPYALILAAIGLIESLMTLNLVDELTETRGSSNRECVAQGGANIVTGLFGGMGGCAMIGQSIINIKGGGRTRLSGIVAALTLLCFILFASGLIEQVPIAALVGVMFMVVIGTFAWSSFRILNKIPKSDALVLVSVSVLTVVFDLAIAVIIGIIMSALVFAWENAKRIRARKRFLDDGTKVYEIWGPLFFGSITTFKNKFDVNGDPDRVIIDFLESRVSDHSALEALFQLVEKYEAAGKKIEIHHLSAECQVLMKKASPMLAKVIESHMDDPRYQVMEEIYN